MGEAFTGRTIPYPLDVSEQDSYAAARGDTLLSRPGEKYVYSDVGYFLLGVITGRVSGMRWRDFVKLRIFEPLGMSDSYVLDRYRIYRNEARGYTIRDGEWVNIRRVHQVETPSHHGTFSNVLDLVKWDAALYGNQLLSDASRTAKWTPARLADGSVHPYGFGWSIECQQGHPVHRHTGITGTEIFRLPGDTLSVIVLTNLGRGAGNQASEVNAWGIASLIAEMLVPTLAPRAAEPLPEDERGQIIGSYRYVSGFVPPDSSVRIGVDDGGLYVHDADGRFPLHYIGDDTFVLTGEPYVVVPERSTAGRVEGWRLYRMHPLPNSGTVRNRGDCAVEPNTFGPLLQRAVRVGDGETSAQR
jgi:CubicO group peptidase (beta-lactamase class C family)